MIVSVPRHAGALRRKEQMRHPDLILAGASVRSLAESAMRIGLIPYCVDQFGDADLSAQLTAAGFGDNLSVVNSFADVPAATATLPANVPLLPVGGLEGNASVMGSLREQRCVLVSPTETLESMHSPGVLFPSLRDAGCNVPDFYTHQQNTAQHSRADRAIESAPWLRKSLDGAGGMGISSATRRDWDSILPNAYLQQRIDGDIVSATFYSAPNGLAGEVKTLGCALQLSGCRELNAPGYQFCGNVRLPKLSAQVQQRFDQIGRRLVSAWPLHGIFGVDTVLQGRQPFVIEVNPRLTASHELHELPAGNSGNHIALQLQAFERTANARIWPRQDDVSFDSRPIARLVLYAECHRTITAHQQDRLLKCCRPPLHQLRNRAAATPAWWLADIPVAESTVQNATPLCSIYVDLGNLGAALDAAEALSEILGGNIAGGVPSFCVQLQAKIADLGER